MTFEEVIEKDNNDLDRLKIELDKFKKHLTTLCEGKNFMKMMMVKRRRKSTR